MPWRLLSTAIRLKVAGEAFYRADEFGISGGNVATSIETQGGKAKITRRPGR